MVEQGEAALRALDELTKDFPVSFTRSLPDIDWPLGDNLTYRIHDNGDAGFSATIRGKDKKMVASSTGGKSTNVDPKTGKVEIEGATYFKTADEAGEWVSRWAVENKVTKRMLLSEIEEIKPGADITGSVYTAEIPDELVSRMLVWDAPLSEQPQAVRDAFERFGIKSGAEKLSWLNANPADNVWISKGVAGNIHYSIVRHDYRPGDAPYELTWIRSNKSEKGNFRTLEDAQAYAQELEGTYNDLYGVDAYKQLAMKIADRDEDSLNWDDVMDAFYAAQMRRGQYDTARFPDGMDEDYNPNPEEIASILLWQNDVPGLRFLDGTARRGGNWRDPDASFNFVLS